MRTPPAICMPQVARITLTDCLIAATGPLPRRMISGRTKNVITDHATASKEASTSRRTVTMTLLSLPLPRTADSSHPTAVWIPAHPIRAGKRPMAAPRPAPKLESRPCNSSSAHFTSPPMKTCVINVATYAAMIRMTMPTIAVLVETSPLAAVSSTPRQPRAATPAPPMTSTAMIARTALTTGKSSM